MIINLNFKVVFLCHTKASLLIHRVPNIYWKAIIFQILIYYVHAFLCPIIVCAKLHFYIWFSKYLNSLISGKPETCPIFKKDQTHFFLARQELFIMYKCET